MKKEHTPGPWRISGCQLGNKLIIEHGGPDEFSPAIASIYTDEGRLPQEANARLIAAAPDLLAVCKNLIEDAAKYKKVQYEAGTFAALNAAISKAEAP